MNGIMVYFCIREMMKKEGKNILVVDDDPDYLIITVSALRRGGYEVVSAGSQAEAEKVIPTFKPDLAIFDLMMEQDDSGFILCYKFKKLYPDVPVILATAVARETGLSFNPSTELERSWIKADRYLEKGMRSEELLAEVKKLLKQ